MTRDQILRCVAEARTSMLALAKLYPAAFDKDGRPLVAALTFPKLPKGKP